MISGCVYFFLFFYSTCESYVSACCVCCFVGDGGGEGHVQWAADSKTGAPTKRKPQQAAGRGADQCHEGAGKNHDHMNTIYVPQNLTVNTKIMVSLSVYSLLSIMYSHGLNDQNTQFSYYISCQMCWLCCQWLFHLFVFHHLPRNIEEQMAVVYATILWYFWLLVSKKEKPKNILILNEGKFICTLPTVFFFRENKVREKHLLLTLTDINTGGYMECDAREHVVDLGRDKSVGV